MWRFLWKMARWAGLLLLVMPRIVGLPTAVSQAEQSRSFWEDAWRWFLEYDLQFWIPMGLLAVGMLVIDLGPYLFQRLESLWHNKELYSKLMQEHDDMGRARRKYWTIMKDIYDGSGKDDVSYGMTLEELVIAAEAPIIDAKNPNVAEWIKGLTGASASLWNHIDWVNRSDKQRDISSREELKDIQRDISNYWNKTAAAIYDEKEISQKKVFERHFPHQSKLLKMILYMECFQMLEFDSKQLRKRFAFRLYQDARKTNQTDESI